jgi:hypothetical protein
MNFKHYSNTLRAIGVTGLVAIATSLVPGCSSDDCENATEGDFAIQFFMYSVEDCNYSGTVVRKAEDGNVESDLTCGFDDGSCTCVGGNAFGTYDVFLTDDDTGLVEYAEFLVAENAATCVTRDALQEFAPVEPGDGDGDMGMGGLGGGGGAGGGGDAGGAGGAE